MITDRILNMSKLRLILILSLTSFLPAQSEDIGSIEEIITTGTIQSDPAMSAWRAGDFATAEISADEELMPAPIGKFELISK